MYGFTVWLRTLTGHMTERLSADRNKPQSTSLCHYLSKKNVILTLQGLKESDSSSHKMIRLPVTLGWVHIFKLELTCKSDPLRPDLIITYWGWGQNAVRFTAAPAHYKEESIPPPLWSTETWRLKTDLRQRTWTVLLQIYSIPMDALCWGWHGCISAEDLWSVLVRSDVSSVLREVIEWWERRCRMCPIHKSVCSLKHLQSNAGEGHRCWSATCILTCTHTNTQYHDHTNSALCHFLSCWPDLNLCSHT